MTPAGQRREAEPRHTSRVVKRHDRGRGRGRGRGCGHKNPGGECRAVVEPFSSHQLSRALINNNPKKQRATTHGGFRPGRISLEGRNPSAKMAQSLRKRLNVNGPRPRRRQDDRTTDTHVDVVVRVFVCAAHAGSRFPFQMQTLFRRQCFTASHTTPIVETGIGRLSMGSTETGKTGVKAASLRGRHAYFLAPNPGGTSSLDLPAELLYHGANALNRDLLGSHV